MNDFLNSLKADLTDRRLLPAVVVVVIALVGGIAYAVLNSGGGGAGSPSVASVAPSPVARGLAVVQTSGSGKAIAETTDGVAAQRSGNAHNPFTLLPSAVKEAAAATAGSSVNKAGAPVGSSSAKTGLSASKGSEPAATPAPTTPATPSKPSTPAKPKKLYKVAVKFGVLPPNVLPQDAELHSYTGLAKATPLPSAKEPRIEYVGVTVSGSNQSALFTVGGEVILHGDGVCLPSATQCKMIQLKEGKNEQLEYLSETGQVTTYELRVLSIATSTASAASVKSVLSAQAHAASRLLGRGGPLKVAGLHFSAQAGVLAFDQHRAFGARARASRRRHRGGR